MNAPVAAPLIDLLRQTRVVEALRAFLPAGLRAGRSSPG